MHNLTLVADPLPFGIEQVAADILAHFGLGVADGRVLSRARAVDLAVEGTATEMPCAIMAALREACPHVDLALLPAANRRKRVLCADMDATMVIGETIDELAAALGKEIEVATITERAMQGELDFREALDARVAMLAGLPAAEIEAVAARLVYSPGAEALVRTMARHGARCVLVSGGFDHMTSVVRARLGFDRDVSNRLEAGPDGTLTGRTIPPIIDSSAKLETMEETLSELGVPAEMALAIGDGANDRAMIEAAGLGIAYLGKPLLRAATPFQINHTDLRTALYFQGYADDEIVDAA